MQFSVVTLFPQMVEPYFKEGVVGGATQRGLISYELINPRSFAEVGGHKSIDDRPFGGGDGMVMMAEPVAQSIELALKKNEGAKTRVVHLTPQGSPLNQNKVNELSQFNHLVLLCGRYAGIDERVIENYVDDEISIGDFVLSGGEPAAICLIDAVSRRIPNVLGNKVSVDSDSFSINSVFESPLFTRPEVWREKRVPSFLLSGHHKNIEEIRWAIGISRLIVRRPDLRDQISTQAKVKALTIVATLNSDEKSRLGLSKLNSPEANEDAR